MFSDVTLPCNPIFAFKTYFWTFFFDQSGLDRNLKICHEKIRKKHRKIFFKMAIFIFAEFQPFPKMDSTAATLNMISRFQKANYIKMLTKK